MTNAPHPWQVRTVRDGSSRVDWSRRVVTFRKPREAPAGFDPVDLGYSHVQTKRDGQRVLVAVGPLLGDSTHREVAVLTTRPTDIYKQYLSHPLWAELMFKLAGLLEYCEDFWIDGELYVPGHGAEAVKTALSSMDPALRFCGFGCSDLDRDADLSHVATWMCSYDIETAPAVRVLDASSRPRDASSPDVDGVVYKKSMYGDWVKKKHRRTVDLIVTGLKGGVGKYWGQVGALIVSDRTGREVACVSGMDDTVRSEMSKKDVGRICEIAYERVASKGRLRHPRFLRWRDDKTEADIL